MAAKVQTSIGELTLMQHRFADAYIRIGNVNPHRAALNAGYSQKTAKRQGALLLENSSVRAYIDHTIKAEADNAIMNRWQALRLLNDIANGKVMDYQIVVEGTGRGESKARVMQKPPSLRDRKEALEVMLKFAEFEGAEEKFEDEKKSTDDRLLQALAKRSTIIEAPDGVAYEEDDADANAAK